MIEVMKEHVLATTDMWVFSWRSKFTVQVSCSEFKLKIHTEVAIKPLENGKILQLNSPWTAKKQPEFKSAETIHIWNTN